MTYNCTFDKVKCDIEGEKEAYPMGFFDFVHDWNGDGIKDAGDAFIEYQIFKQVTGTDEDGDNEDQEEEDQ